MSLGALGKRCVSELPYRNEQQRQCLMFCDTARTCALWPNPEPKPLIGDIKLRSAGVEG